MTLKDYIKLVLSESPIREDINFEVNLFADGTVADEPTGNKIYFTVTNLYESTN